MTKLIKINVVKKRVMHGYVIEETSDDLFFTVDNDIAGRIKDIIYSVLSCMYFAITADGRAYTCNSNECLEVRISVDVENE